MPRTIIAIDPGPTQSAWVALKDGRPAEFGIDPNGVVRGILWLWDEPPEPTVVVEMVACYGMPVGEDVFQTCVEIGRFIEMWAPRPHSLLYRRQVKMHLCGSMRAKDSNIRQALIDRFGPGKAKAIGLKKTPGPLYGFKKDLWAALAVAVTYADTEAPDG